MINPINSNPLSGSEAQAWLKDTPARAQAAFEALATMQLLQEVADNAEAVVDATGTLPADAELAGGLHRLTCAATLRLVEVSRRQIETLRALLEV